TLFGKDRRHSRRANAGSDPQAQRSIRRDIRIYRLGLHHTTAGSRRGARGRHQCETGVRRDIPPRLIAWEALIATLKVDVHRLGSCGQLFLKMTLPQKRQERDIHQKGTAARGEALMRENFDYYRRCAKRAVPAAALVVALAASGPALAQDRGTMR